MIVHQMRQVIQSSSLESCDVGVSVGRPCLEVGEEAECTDTEADTNRELRGCEVNTMALRWSEQPHHGPLKHLK